MGTLNNEVLSIQDPQVTSLFHLCRLSVKNYSDYTYYIGYLRQDFAPLFISSEGRGNEVKVIPPIPPPPKYIV